MKHLQKLAFIALFIYLPFNGKAWGVEGHRIVGQIADSYLTKHAKKEIEKILGNESVAMASNWADFIKSDPAYKYLGNWHYVNLKSGLSFDQVNTFLTTDTSTNAYNKIIFISNELKNNKLLAPAMKQMYLRLLIHFIGDIHQPMHLGRPDDRGGNSIKLSWFGSIVNLHQVWDEKLIEFQDLSYTEYATAINHTTKEQRNAWQQQTLSQWIFDTYQVTEKIYAETKADDKLDYLYNFKFIAPLNDQLVKGGVHLAAILNDIFK